MGPNFGQVLPVEFVEFDQRSILNAILWIILTSDASGGLISLQDGQPKSISIELKNIKLWPSIFPNLIITNINHDYCLHSSSLETFALFKS